jgi:hypothetical protein
MPLFDRQSKVRQIPVNDDLSQALARGEQVGSGGGKGGGEWSRKLRRGPAGPSQIAVLNSEERALPIETSELVTAPTSIPYGARGRDPGGWPKVIPVGLPEAIAGEAHRLQVPKELRIPQIPGNFSSWVAVSGAVTSGGTVVLEEPISFPARTLQIDNYTSIFLYLDGAERYIPPATMGWQFLLGRGITTVRVRAIAPPNFVQPAFTAGGVFYVFAFEAALAQIGTGIAV